MQAEILTIGDELLIGQVVNTNAAFLSRALNAAGIHVVRSTTVPDQVETIIDFLSEASKRVRLIVSTGGLGPTRDDTTKSAFCDFTGDELVQDPAVLAHVEHLFAHYISTPISERNRQQALVPRRARVLHNPHGTAPGLWMEQQGVVLVALPGVPYEMEYLVTETLIPLLMKQFETEAILHRTLLTYGLGESAIADRIAHIEEALPSHIKLAYLPNAGKVRLRLSGRGPDAEALKQELDKHVRLLYAELSDIITGEEGKGELTALIGNRLRQDGLSLAIAESLSGGRISAAIVGEPGASDYYRGGVVTYATASKVRILGLSPDLIQRHTVVSAEVAGAMAREVATRFGADFGLATTGVAGPDPGESGQPVGTVWIAVHGPEGTRTEKFTFGTHRERITLKTVNKALELLYAELCKKSQEEFL